ncbi:hypothetical protein ACSBR1_020785 [Camellia fascicularis]
MVSRDKTTTTIAAVNGGRVVNGKETRYRAHAYDSVAREFCDTKAKTNLPTPSKLVLTIVVTADNNQIISVNTLPPDLKK